MEKIDLTCLFFPDLLPWERNAIDPIVTRLSETHRIQLLEVSELDRRQLKELRHSGHLWVIANRWQQALDFLAVPRQGRAYVSVLGPVSAPENVAVVLWRWLRPLVARSITLMAHSPLSYRFLREIQRVPESQLVYAPLPLHGELRKLSVASKRVNDSMVVGTLGRFTSENNFNYFLNVAHYVSRRNTSIRFRILGGGPLANHIRGMVAALDLSHLVSIEDKRETWELGSMDIFIYSPLQNEHFIPLLMAGAVGLPSLASEIPGIERYLMDGRDGFVVGANETRPMGELVLRLCADAVLREKMSANFVEHLHQKFSAQEISPLYENLFFNSTQPLSIVEAA